LYFYVAATATHKINDKVILSNGQSYIFLFKYKQKRLGIIGEKSSFKHEGFGEGEKPLRSEMRQ